jgi:ATP-dependent DNA helicase RecG
VIVVGLSAGVVEGVGSRRRQVNEWRQAALDFTVPPVPARTREVACLNDRGEPDALLVIELEPSERVHANRREEVFLRAGDETRRLTPSQAQELVYDKGQAFFEGTPIDAGTDELDGVLLGSYADAIVHPEPLRLLQARGLVTRQGTLTVGALLLFGEHPQDRYPEATVRVLRYRGTERGAGARQQLLEDTRLEGPLPRVIQASASEIVDRVPTRQALGWDGLFGPVGLIPRDAWLEGLVNAVIHRSYSVMGDHIRVEIFDDRIEIESPGRFPGLVDPAKPLSVTRFARNPRIARVCADLRLGQELGEGIRRMFEEMRLAGLADPTYRQTSGSVVLTLSAEAVDRELEARLPRGARELLQTIRLGPRPSTGDLARALSLSRPVVIRRLRALEDEGLVEWVGKSPNDPRAYWRLAR